MSAGFLSSLVEIDRSPDPFAQEFEGGEHHYEQFVEEVQQALALVPEPIAEYLIKTGFRIHICHQISDINPTINSLEKAGCCTQNTPYQVIIPAYINTEKFGIQPSTIGTKVALHEIGHALDIAFGILGLGALSKTPEFIAACNADNATANQTLNVATETPHPGVFSEILKIQLNEDIGKAEIFANHFAHIISGKPYLNIFPASFRNSLEAAFEKLQKENLLKGLSDETLTAVQAVISREKYSSTRAGEVMWKNIQTLEQERRDGTTPGQQYRVLPEGVEIEVISHFKKASLLSTLRNKAYTTFASTPLNRWLNPIGSANTSPSCNRA